MAPHIFGGDYEDFTLRGHIIPGTGDDPPFDYGRIGMGRRLDAVLGHTPFVPCGTTDGFDPGNGNAGSRGRRLEIRKSESERYSKIRKPERWRPLAGCC